ncbi:MAG: sugar phosphate isomerase/epimerase [Oscillospiraceae bacterium]|nr:sugar phosphate isomerase/epimerase [Oscillospiraceae bacterium]
MKISVSSYSYLNIFGKDGFDIYKLVKTVKQQGFDGIEIASLPNQNQNGEDDLFEFFRLIKKLCADEGLEIPNYCVGSDFLNGSGGDIEKEIAKVKHNVDLAEALGSFGIRHDATWGIKKETPPPRGFDDIVDRLAYAYRAVTEYAEKKGIATSVENHGYFVQDSVRVEKLINKTGHKNFGVTLDIGNFLCADEDPVYAVGILAPYIKHVHAKDFHVKSGMGPNPGEGFFKSRGGNYLRGSIIGHGNVPVDQCVNIIKSSGYDGYISIEFEGLEDPVKATSIGLDYLRRF